MQCERVMDVTRYTLHIGPCVGSADAGNTQRGRSPCCRDAAELVHSAAQGLGQRPTDEAAQCLLAVATI